MKVALLGANGQLAQSYVQRFKKANIAFESFSSADANFLKPETVIHCLKRGKFTHVINTMAYTMVDKAESEREAALQINGKCVGVVAQFCADAGLPLIHYSTDYVYPGTGSAPWKESSPVDPQNWYGQTKLEGENQIRQSGCRHLIFRTSWVYSPWGTNFLKTMLKLGKERKELSIVSDQIGGPTFAPDLAETSLRCLQAWDSRSQDGVYHLAGEGYCSWYEFAQEIFAAAEKRGWQLSLEKLTRIETKDYSTPAKRPLNSRLDLGKVKTTFGVKMPQWKDSMHLCMEMIAGNL